MRLGLKKLVLLLVSSLLCFAVAEVTVRLLGHNTVGKRSGNVVLHQTPEFAHRAVLNSIDLRDEEIGPKLPGEIRILAIGDSFTYGLGVEEGETYVRRTESLLRARFAAPGGDSIRVINGGVGGGPGRQAAWLRETGVELEPDVVVLGFYVGNDLYDDLAWERGDPMNADRKGVRSLLSKSMFLDWAWSRLVAIDRVDRWLFRYGARKSPRGMYLVDQPELEQRAWETTLDRIEEIAETAARAGAQTLVMIIPTSNQVRRPDEFETGSDPRLPNRILTDRLDRARIPHLDLLDTLTKEDAGNRLYFRRDIHWTPAGHHVAATLLAERIDRLLTPSIDVVEDRP